MAREEPNWSFTLVKGGSFSHTLTFEDNDGNGVDVSDKKPRMLVKTGSVICADWKRADGYFTSTAADTFRFDLTTAQIEALTFKSAYFFFFLNDEDELLFSGTIQVK